MNQYPDCPSCGYVGPPRPSNANECPICEGCLDSSIPYAGWAVVRGGLLWLALVAGPFLLALAFLSWVFGETIR